MTSILHLDFWSSRKFTLLDIHCHILGNIFFFFFILNFWEMCAFIAFTSALALTGTQPYRVFRIRQK